MKKKMKKMTGDWIEVKFSSGRKPTKLEKFICWFGGHEINFYTSTAIFRHCNRCNRRFQWKKK